MIHNARAIIKWKLYNAILVLISTEVGVTYPSQSIKTFVILFLPVSLISFKALLIALYVGHSLSFSSPNPTSWCVSRTFYKLHRLSLLPFLPNASSSFRLQLKYVIISKNLIHQHCSQCVYSFILHARGLLVPFVTQQFISKSVICLCKCFGGH